MRLFRWLKYEIFAKKYGMFESQRDMQSHYIYELPTLQILVKNYVKGPITLVGFQDFYWRVCKFYP